MKRTSKTSMFQWSGFYVTRWLRSVCGVTQLLCLQYLIHEVASGGSPKKAGGFFGSSDTDVPSAEMRQLELFFNRISLFPHILDYRGMPWAKSHSGTLRLSHSDSVLCIEKTEAGKNISSFLLKSMPNRQFLCKFQEKYISGNYHRI